MLWALIFTVAAFPCPAAHAECRGGMPGLGTSPMCTPDTSPGEGGFFRQPDPLAGQSARFKNILNRLAQFSPNARDYKRLGMPGSEAELASRLDSLYEAAFSDYSRLYDESMIASIQIGRFQRELPVLQNRIATLSRENDAKRRQIAVMQSDIQQQEAMTRQAQARIEELTYETRGVVMLLDRYDALLEYLMVFSPEPEAILWRPMSPPPVQSPLFTGLKEIPPEPIVYPLATPAAPFAEERPQFERAFHAALPTDIEGKLVAAQNLANGLRQVTQERNRFVPKAAALKSQYDPLVEQNRNLVWENYNLSDTAWGLQHKLAHATEVARVTQENQQSVARQFVQYMVYDYALEAGKEKLIDRIEHVLDVHGIQDVPLDSQSAIRRMAYEAKRIALPRKGFEKEWEAFIEVQERTLKLVNKTEGYLMESARLAAEGTPDEMEAYMERVFKNLKWETAEYVKTAGMASLPDKASESFLVKVFDQYISFKKSKDGVE